MKKIDLTEVLTFKQFLKEYKDSKMPKQCSHCGGTVNQFMAQITQRQDRTRVMHAAEQERDENFNSSCRL
jgi:hypothetical protein